MIGEFLEFYFEVLTDFCLLGGEEALILFLLEEFTQFEREFFEPAEHAALRMRVRKGGEWGELGSTSKKLSKYLA